MNKRLPTNQSTNCVIFRKKSDSGSYIVQFNDDQDIESARGLTKALVNIIGRNPNFVYENSINTPSSHRLGVALANQIKQTEGSSGDIANMSLGGPFSEALNDAVISAAGKGIKFVNAAGNSGADANNESPASANGAYVHMISAMSQGDNWAYFSNYGNLPVDYCATGWRRRSVQLQHAAQVWRHLMLPVFSCKEM